MRCKQVKGAQLLRAISMSYDLVHESLDFHGVSADILHTQFGNASCGQPVGSQKIPNISKTGWREQGQNLVVSELSGQGITSQGGTASKCC